MTYRNGFVAVVKCEGAILREIDGAVRLPFGAEYSILLKNLESRKAVVRVSIDGEDVCGGNRLVVHPNTPLELHGFVDGNNIRNKFKFIKKTDTVVMDRGDRIDDGMIRVEYWFEKPAPVKTTIVEEHIHHHRRDYPPYIQPYVPWEWEPYYVWTSASYPGTTMLNTAYSSAVRSLNNSEQVLSCRSPEIGVAEGVTVRGGATSQTLGFAHVGELEDTSNAIVIQMVGDVVASGVVITSNIPSPITIKTRFSCPSCGRSCKSSFKHCPECGAYLL